MVKTSKFIKGFNNALKVVLILSLVTTTAPFCTFSFGQNITGTSIWKTLISIEDDTTTTIEKKLPKVRILKKQFEDQKLPEDSVYARILHRVGFLEYKLNNDVATKDAIIFTHAAINVNSRGTKDCIPAFCVNSYTNLAIYYGTLHMNDMALRCYDSAIMLKKQYQVPQISEVSLLLDKAEMLTAIGDYQKAIEETNIGILKAKSENEASVLPSLFNQRARAYLMGGQLEQALKDVGFAATFSKQFNDNKEATNSVMIEALIMAGQKEFSKALILFNRGIKQRLQTDDYSQISDDYTDFGNFYLNDLQNYSKATECYSNTIKYALKAQDFERQSKGHINLEQCNFRQHKYQEAESFCNEALKDLNVDLTNNNTPSAAQLNSIGNKELILFILTNKTELLLTQFNVTGNKNYLSSCLQTAMVADSLINLIRHQQLGEQSKLYWRNKTREFFTHALEACFLANNATQAFYFMEKSRAVLLNDNLNELGASAQLPTAEKEKERELQIAAISIQQNIAALKSGENERELQLVKLSDAKGTLEHFIRSLEKKYPAYYQYKYADDVSSLNDLQKQLLKNKQSFVHYFINDTVAYILGITPSNTRMLKLSKNDFNSQQLIKFLELCSYEPTSNNDYHSFTSLSYSLYKLLFQPLHVAKGRVVICPDNFLIPFEALSTDSAGNNYLIDDYVFSYVYSARYLLKKYPSFPANGDFIGFAPISFKAYSSIADLKQSGEALHHSGRFYYHSTLLTNNDATRHSFINAVSDYSIVNVFSHALADTTDNEPVLYMHDSVIHLSELQLLPFPATKLVVLSACQTNVGHLATGEGVLSLARGFASAGIPAVAATLWKADEHTIYAISEKFHEFLSKGLPKDEALQKAKLYFIQHGEFDKPFPYYWANMILVGNDQPVKVSANHHTIWWILGIVIFVTAVLLVLKIKKNKSF